MTKRSVLREIFSGANGKLSAKRVIGGLAMSVALACIVFLVIRDGSTSVVENLLMTILIISASLLGLPAVTGIWGSSKVSTGSSQTEYDTPPVSEPVITEPEEPIELASCDHCPYCKKHH
jgi:hypothetical protein